MLGEVVPEPRDAEEGISRQRISLVKASEGFSRLGTGKFYTQDRLGLTKKNDVLTKRDWMNKVTGESITLSMCS